MVIVAGGSGTRMGAELPKQFIELNGKPILMHTLETMRGFDREMQLVLVLPESQIGFWKELCEKHAFTIPHKVTKGGSTRFLSVKSGLEQVTGELVGIHDGVRPFVSHEVMKSCFSAAENQGAAVPVVPIVQSLRKVDTDGNAAVNRDEFRAVQTPQCFKSELLKTAFMNAPRTDYSDDATVAEASGNEIHLVEGNQENIKLTNPFDLELARLIIARRTDSN
jgi:2-C-methyl-D-erythritol 4-phosphate cytidylyltransferase